MQNETIKFCLKKDVPVISAKDLPEADGYIFGVPTRFLLNKI